MFFNEKEICNTMFVNKKICIDIYCRFFYGINSKGLWQKLHINSIDIIGQIPISYIVYYVEK